MKTPTALAAGAACCSSGVALVLHILTGSPLWLTLAAVGLVASAGLVVTAAGDKAALGELRILARRGVLVGLVGTVAYDASRWLLAKLGGLQLSPFEALPLFGQALIGQRGDSALVTAAGVAYHLLNGVAFGTAFVIWFRHKAWWWGIIFALGLEAAMLAIYPGWLDPASISELTQVSLVGHFAYGTTLGLTATWLAGGSANGINPSEHLRHQKVQDG